MRLFNYVHYTLLLLHLLPANLFVADKDALALRAQRVSGSWHGWSQAKGEDS